jgi:hypothetical protein
MPTAAYSPRLLSDSPQPGIVPLVEKARTGQLILFIGAGVSAAAPSNGPMGSVVADRLRAAAAEIIGCSQDSLSGCKLEELAERALSVGTDGIQRLRQLAGEAFDFAGITPNYGHRAIALLMREGLVRVITVNWDCGIERAGLEAGVTIAPVTSVITAQPATDQLRLYKVHGTATDPASLKITTSDVDKPDTWAIAEVQSALTNGTIVFAGLATVGDYVSSPIEQILADWSGYASAVRVVAPSVPDAWSEILGKESADAAHFPSYANDFFDDLLRALITDCLQRVAMKSSNLAQLEDWASTMSAGSGLVTQASKSAQAHQLLEWWRGGVSSTQAGTPFIGEKPGQDSLMAVSLLAGTDGDIEMAGRGRRFSTRTSKQYIEVLSKPGAHFSEIETIAEDMATRRWEDGAYDDARPITFVVPGATGKFPSFGAVADIAGVDSLDEIDASIRGELRFVSAEQALQGGLS